MTMGDDVVLRIDSACRSFGERRVLTSATLCARRGRVTVLFGRNGCGKSTLLRIGAGLLAPESGVITFAGRKWMRTRLHVVARRGLFYLPERGLLAHTLTLRAHLDMVTRRFGGNAAWAGHVAELGLDSLLDRRPDQLSGGEQRRGELAIALTRGPKVMLADEPLMGIAPVDAERIGAALRRLAAAGCAVVVTGHEVPTLLDYADDVVWMTAGTTHELGAPASALLNWQFRREYLGASKVPHLNERP